jgi:glycosyltransferase involved in cell wall biosynthesis
LGLGANWASCVQIARANYIAPIDDDDYWCDNLKLQKQVDFLDGNSEYGLIHTNYFNFYDNSKKKVLANPKFELNPENLMKSIFTGKYLINPGTACFRKDLFSSYLDYYIANKFPIQDWPSWLILSKKSKFMYLDTPTLMYRKVVGNMSNPDSYEKIVRKYTKEKMMYKFLCDLFPDDLPFDENGYDVYVNGVLLGLAYKKMDYRNAHKYGSVMKSQGSNSLKVRCTQNRIPFYAFWLLQKLKSLITNH